MLKGIVAEALVGVHLRSCRNEEVSFCHFENAPLRYLHQLSKLLLFLFLRFLAWQKNFVSVSKKSLALPAELLDLVAEREMRQQAGGYA